MTVFDIYLIGILYFKEIIYLVYFGTSGSILYDFESLFSS